MNYYKQVAEMLGVELNEEFDINYMLYYRYMLTKDGMKFKDKSSDTCLGYSSPVLSKLLRGDYSIVKLPWKPKADEFYYCYSPYVGIPYQERWINTSSDYCMWKLGNCFRTKEEAETKGKEIMEQIVKEYRES